jgi:lipoprotein-releasing system permease protein
MASDSEPRAPASGSTTPRAPAYGFNRFESFVALRYLRAKRKQAVISIITVISVAGVAAGVMALVVALAINNGFRNTLERTLLGATAHVIVLQKDPLQPIENSPELVPKLRALRHVVSAAPTLYGPIFLSAPLRSDGAQLKGVPIESGGPAGDLARFMKKGTPADLAKPSGIPGIILGSRLSERTGLLYNSVATVISPQGELTPFGALPATFKFRVVGIFETGFYELDAAWAFTSLSNAQRVLGLNGVVNAIELRLDDIDLAPEVAREAEREAGPDKAATHWMELNRQVFAALRMEKVVTVVTIGLITLVAALNILIALVMMVMEKYRDISVLMSMGARREQIRRIFVFQGLIIGTLGTVVGLTAGHLLSFLANRYQWIRMDAEVYEFGFVPFEPRWVDSVWIAGAAILISYLATLYPSRNATRISPAEALRYE